MTAGRPKGQPKSGGRQKGTPNKKRAEIIQQALGTGISPLEYMLQIMRDEAQPDARRDEMARAAAPFVHPRLNSVDANVKLSGHEAALELLK